MVVDVVATSLVGQWPASPRAHPTAPPSALLAPTLTSWWARSQHQHSRQSEPFLGAGRLRDVLPRDGLPRGGEGRPTHASLRQP